MTKWHIKENGEPGECSAGEGDNPRDCPRGGANDHYDTAAEARVRYDANIERIKQLVQYIVEDDSDSEVTLIKREFSVVENEIAEDKKLLGESDYSTSIFAEKGYYNSATVRAHHDVKNLLRHAFANPVTRQVLQSNAFQNAKSLVVKQMGTGTSVGVAGENAFVQYEMRVKLDTESKIADDSLAVEDARELRESVGKHLDIVRIAVGSKHDSALRSELLNDSAVDSESLDTAAYRLTGWALNNLGFDGSYDVYTVSEKVFGFGSSRVQVAGRELLVKALGE